MGEILPGSEAGQRFLARRDGLESVKVRLGTFGRSNQGRIEFRLHEDEPRGEPIRIVTAEMGEIRDGTYHTFPFEPVASSAGQTYAFTLRSPDASPGNAVTAWMHPRGRDPEGRRLVGGEPASGDLAYAASFREGADRYRLVYDEEVRIFENRSRLPRAFVVPAAEWVASPEEARARLLAHLLSGSFDPRATVILEGEEGPGERRPIEFAAGSGPRSNSATLARIAFHGANRVSIEVDPEATGYLVLLDTYFSGWSARVDGAEVPVLPAYGMFRAVPLEIGSRRVEMVYRPPSLRLGLALFVLAALGLAACNLRRLRR